MLAFISRELSTKENKSCYNCMEFLIEDCSEFLYTTSDEEEEHNAEMAKIMRVKI